MSVMRATMVRIVLSAALSTGIWWMAPDTVHAAVKKMTVIAKVVDESGRPHASAAAVACPVVNGEQDCSHPVRSETNRAGFATLKLDTDVQYGVFGVVHDPQPAWACPGVVVDGQELYLSDRIDALGRDVPRMLTFTITKPSPLDCVVVTVTDDAGNNLLQKAGLFVCAHTPGSSECIGEPFAPQDLDGTIRMKIDPELIYDLGAFAGNLDWPCPGFILDDGSPLWFGESGSFTADDLLAGVTLVIPQPSPEDCVQILIADDSGNPLRHSTVWICAHAPGSSDCVGVRDRGADEHGVVTMAIDLSLVYDLRPVANNTGWPCPSTVFADGSTFHIGDQSSFTGSDLLAGVTLLVPIPSADDCVAIGVTDDAGNPLPTGGLFVCAHALGSADCIGERFEGPDPDGLIRMLIDPTLLYDLGPFVTNTGWPCPGYIADDGTQFHFGANQSFTADQLLNGVTLVIPVPRPEDCVHIVITDDAGNPLPHSTVWICAHLPGSTDCVGQRDQGADGNGVVTLAIDPTLIYDLRPVANNTGWPCPSYVFADGNTFHIGEQTSFTATDLVQGVTLTVAVPGPDDCAEISITDDTGNPLPTAGLFVCAHTPGSADCIGERFDGPDPDGVVRMSVDPDLVYDIGAFIANPGWPCPSFFLSDGTVFYFSPNTTFAPDQLVAGATLVIHRPAPDDCVRLQITDDSGNLLLASATTICAHLPGSTDCIGSTFAGADPLTGLVTIMLDPTLVYDLGPQAHDTGWPCPSFIWTDGVAYWNGLFVSLTYDELLAAAPDLVVPQPSPEACA